MKENVNEKSTPSDHFVLPPLSEALNDLAENSASEPLNNTEEDDNYEDDAHRNLASQNNHTALEQRQIDGIENFRINSILISSFITVPSFCSVYYAEPILKSVFHQNDIAVNLASDFLKTYALGLSSAVTLALLIRWYNTPNILETKEKGDSSHKDKSPITPEVRETNSSNESMIHLAFERFSGILNRLNPCPAEPDSNRHSSTSDSEFEDVTLTHN